MTQDNLTHAVDAHATALNKGIDISADLLSKLPDHKQELSSLFNVARGLQIALVPVEANAFKAKLGSRLRTNWGRRRVSLTSQPQWRRAWSLVAIAGSALSVLGVGVLLVRRLRASGGHQTESTPVPA